MPTEQECGGGGSARRLLISPPGPMAVILALIVSGVGMILAAVWLLIGFAWALLLAGIITIAAAWLVRRGLIVNG